MPARHMPSRERLYGDVCARERVERVSSTPKLLIAENEAIIAADLAEMANEWGWSVLGPVRDADQAIRLACEDRPDVALVGIYLHRGRPTGIDVAAELQGEMGIPVVYLSCLSDEKLATPPDSRSRLRTSRSRLSRQTSNASSSARWADPVR